MDPKFLKPYNPKTSEDKIYEKWEQSGLFNPDLCQTEKSAPSFSIVLPPPNVTGTLHIGHALMLAIQDILIRYHRMKGDKTLWLPGTDHAAIATQTVVEKRLAKEKLRKYDLGREAFLEKVNQFARESHDTITGQIRKMGSSVDWSREAFTLDEKRTRAVYTAFKKMYDDGLIYRKYRVVNWDPKGQTTVSDDEVNYEEQSATLYTFRYSKDFPIPIATTRPETKVGDVAVAVHPEDPRYQKFIGQTFAVNFAGTDLSIKIIGDQEIDPEFGTGAVGVTPAHSMVDWQIAERHDLPLKQVINEFAKMDLPNDLLNGKKTLEARELVANWLRENNLLEKEEKIVQNISKAERSGGTIEPLPKLQWFVDVEKKFVMQNSKLSSVSNGSKVSLKDLMKKVVESGEVQIIPDRFQKVYFNWIDNLHDWCISRQIWYGHRIPVWYRNQNDEDVYVGIVPPDGDDWTQDEDTLDTWFSSGLWTFSTLGWPDATDDLKTFHPTSVLETAHDILFFWVARMILMSTYLLGEVPFKVVYLHGMVLDKNGKKMSKSRPETAVDPVESIEEFGADALRMAMIVGVGPGQTLTLSKEKIGAYKKFANKIWNAARFVLESTEGIEIPESMPELGAREKKWYEEFQNVLGEITEDIEKYRLYLAAEKLYHYFWHTFADIIIEESKPTLKSDDESARQKTTWTLHHILKNSLKALHPFMPFITEEIWSTFSKDETMIMVEEWPIQ